MSYKSRAQVMRDRDDLDEQRWQPAASNGVRESDPLAELARIVGQGAVFQPRESQAPVAPAAPAAGTQTSQQDWINEIERAFSQAIPQAAPAPASPAPEAEHAGVRVGADVPAWLRSPAVPQLPVPEGQRDPRLDPDAFSQEFSQALDGVSGNGANIGYYAQDAYQLAAGGPEAFSAAAQPEATAYADDPRSAAVAEAHGYNAQGYGAPNYGVYDDLEDEHRAAAEAGEDDDYAYAHQDDRRGLRRKVVAAGLVLGLGALAAAGVFMFRGGEVVNGEPPVVSADSQPVKVEPETPGGVEVPNTNRAIYEHTNQAPSGEGAVVVDDREQPVDINQMIAQQSAAAQAQAIQQRAGATTTTTRVETTTAPTVGAADVTLPEAPQPTSPAMAALGEPRRVRTVSVRPDGSILPAGTAPAAAAAAPTIDQLASATPSVVSPTTPVVSSPEAPVPAQAEAPAVAPPVGPVPRPAVVNRPATRAPLQLGPMAISPQAAGSQAANAPPAVPLTQSAQVSPQAASGSFTVQLAAPGSENEARNLFASLQRRHGELSGFSPSIVRADTGGRTIYRLRVGSFQSRDQATALCVRIQASGGQCFVARN